MNEESKGKDRVGDRRSKMFRKEEHPWCEFRPPRPFCHCLKESNSPHELYFLSRSKKERKTAPKTIL